MRCNTPGDVVDGKYRLISELGQGGMGKVWHARHMRLDCPIALKVIDPVIAMDPHALQRFLREARTAAALRGPHVVQILDYGVDDEGTPYIAMEMLDGQSLAEQLKRSGRLSTPETARVIRHVSRALGRAHDAGIVHRDLKPENIFVLRNDDDVIIKVLDFGIVKVAPANSGNTLATHSGTLMGTPFFMSPEQVAGLDSVDFRSDIWALGVIAYECLLGALPFRGDNLPRLILAICRDPLPVPSEVGVVPVGFDPWFARACARDPLNRFESAKQAADEFDGLDSCAAAGPPSRQRSAAENAALDREPLGLGAAHAVAANVPRVPFHHRVHPRMAVAMLGTLLLGAAATLGKDWFRSAPTESSSGRSPPEPGTVETRLLVPAKPFPEPLDTSTALERGPIVEEAPAPSSAKEPTTVERTAMSAAATARAKPGTVTSKAKRSAPKRSGKNKTARRPPQTKPPIVDLGI